MDVVWLPVAIVLVALGVFAAVRLFQPDKGDLVGDTHKRAQDLKAAAEAALAAELHTLKGDREELDRIRGIESDAERLQALADYSNRRAAK